MWKLFEKLGPVLILLVLFGLLAAIIPGFITTRNLRTIAIQSAVTAIIAFGETLVIIAGGIDLSVGTVMSFSMVVMGVLNVYVGLPLGIAVFGALLAGISCGTINGVLVTYLNIPPFISTLGMLGIAQGAALLLSGGYSMYGFPQSFRIVASGALAGIPIAMLIVGGIAILYIFALSNLKIGIYAFAIGGNEMAARAAGIPIKRYKILYYALSGCTAAAGGVVLASRIFSAHPGIGTGYELDAITAAVIGGASLLGGRGSIFGTIIGALIMATIRYSLNLLGISSFWQQIAVGAILLFAVALDNIRRAREKVVVKPPTGLKT